MKQPKKSESPKPPGGPSRLNITLVMDIDGNIEAFSNIKVACRAHKWSYFTVIEKPFPVYMPGGFTIYHLKINYGKTINDGENV
jgi:hypothetical protein